MDVRCWVAACVFLAGCSSAPRDFTREYHEALGERPGVTMDNWMEGKRAVSRFAGLYGDLTPANVTAKVREVYAPNAWFNDTIATEVGIDAIESYLLKTAKGTEAVQAKVQDVAVSGADCYVRWTMEVRAKNLAGGEPVITEGMSHLRFDDQGKIILHQDFWNPASGIYQQLPLLGPAIRYVNGLITKP
ncbi:MAG: nuclear transport factor 2 family protein [Chthoniobacterales bacterium]|nr:nuclear transport factor 2 family protein [Chthoniobacterales bacterium]